MWGLLATWFCIQCLTRFFQHLAISLLELNTFGHAVCTLFIYALWWHKPLDIEEPEVISIPSDKPEVFELLAAMCLKSKVEYVPCQREFPATVQKLVGGGRGVVAGSQNTRMPIVFTVQYDPASWKGRFAQPFTEPKYQRWKSFWLSRRVISPDTTIDCDRPC